MKKSYKLLLIAFAFSCMASAQSISLDWVQTEQYGVDNMGDVFIIDKSTNDIVTGVMGVYLDPNNQYHANALNRRNQQGQMICDTIFNDTSYLNYRLRGFYPKNGDTYYCLNYQSSNLIFEKISVTGQLLWQQQLPRATLFFAYDWNLKGNNYVIDDSLNNRMLWMFEQYDPAFTTRSIGVLATDNTTGAITIIDTLSQSSQATWNSFAVELQRDNYNHIYLSSSDSNPGMRISLLENGQWTTVAAHDSVGERDYPQSMRIVGNTMFVTSRIELNSYSINKLRIYSIDSAGHLTLISEQNMSDTQNYLLGMRTFNNCCYVFTSGYVNFGYPMLTPTIWKYDNAGNLISTFTLSNFVSKCILDLAVTNNAIYCSMYSSAGYNMLEVIDPFAGQHLTNYSLLYEFTASANDGAYQVEAYSTNATSDVIFIAGNQWVNNTNIFARLARYEYQGMENSTGELSDDPILTVFPNPAKDRLFVNYASEDYTIEITDAAGKLILSQQAQTAQQVLAIGELSKGIYFIRLHDTEKTVVRKFVKE